MTRLVTSVMLIALACGLCGASPARAQLLAGAFTASPPAFSPDGNAVNDTTALTFILAGPAITLSVIVFAADSITPVDTLVAPGPINTTGSRRVGWDGLAWDGSPAPEGAYVVTLFGRSQALVDTTLSIPLFVDVTPPSLQLIGVSPSPYVPGLLGQASTLNVTMVLSGISAVTPGRVPDEVQLRITGPNGARVKAEDLEGRISFEPSLLSVTPPSVGTDGTYRMLWDAFDQTPLTDGNYTVALFLVDVAGFSTSDSVLADFDIAGPRVEYLSLRNGSAVPVLPDSLKGWAYDRNGVDSLRVKYGNSKPYRPVTNWYVQNDTAFFAIPLADSFPAEGAYSLTVRATDGTSSFCPGCPGRVTAAVLKFGFDRTPPAPPRLDPFSGVWHTDTYPLRGDVPADAGLAEVIRILRNDVQVDSVFTLLDDRFERRIGLLPGRNTFTSTHVDSAGNESVASNSVVVTFQGGGGLFAPVPFRPGDDFMINIATPARSAEVRVYDLTGDLVRVLESSASTDRYVIKWNGTNLSGETVRKGPLVAVAMVRFEDGTTRHFRELFLLEAGE